MSLLKTKENNVEETNGIKLEMYSIKDELNGFTVPIPMISKEIAIRYFKDQMLGNVTMKNSPKDFSLWKMGIFNTKTGKYMSLENGLELIERGENYGDINKTGV